MGQAPKANDRPTSATWTQNGRWSGFFEGATIVSATLTRFAARTRQNVENLEIRGLPQNVVDEMAALEKSTRQLEDAASQRAEAFRRACQTMLAAGFSAGDVGRILNVSRQRVRQVAPAKESLTSPFEARAQSK